jgi:hypothetical protein
MCVCLCGVKPRTGWCFFLGLGCDKCGVFSKGDIKKLEWKSGNTCL